VGVNEKPDTDVATAGGDASDPARGGQLLQAAAVSLSNVSIGGHNYGSVPAIEIIFRPGGGTYLNPSHAYYLTLRDLNKGGDEPARLVTLQINPVTGRSSLFTP